MTEARIQRAIARIVAGKHLSEAEMHETLGLVMDGAATDAQIAGLLTALRMKGETVEEITGAVKAMRGRATRLHPRAQRIMDTCGTGGDGAGTFNVSTAVAIVCAAAGVTVAKHGNRAMSSKVGSADVLEVLGVRIDLEAAEVTRCVDEIGIGFMFAPHHHSALRHAAPVRKQLGFHTLLNLLGPMTNPAGATHQLIGVFDRARLATVAQVLGRLGSRRAIVVHGSDGLDELTLAGPTHIAVLDGGAVTGSSVTPESYGIPRTPTSALVGGDGERNAELLREALAGVAGPAHDVVRYNAGAALWAAEEVDDLAAGVARASDVIAAGQATEKLAELVALTGEIAR